MSDPTQTDIPIETSNGQDGTRPIDTPMIDQSPASPAQSVGSNGRASFQSHARTISNVSGPLASGRPNRYSVHFPVTPAGADGTPRRSISPLRDRAPASEDVPVEASVPSDGNFLQSIAAAERKVLEMREELHRAEADLNQLKRQWTRHEAQKKREDARRSTKMQPLQTSLPAADREEDSDGSSAWMQHEMERRKALLNGSRTSNRTVLPGQRHTRTLSLLSPTRDSTVPSPIAAPKPPLQKDSVKTGDWQDLDRIVQAARNVPLPRASTISDFGDSADKALQASLNLNLMENNIDQEALLRTGKKMAATFKDGLWTFWEDLRQATVGEDATQPSAVPRKKGSTQTLKTAKKQNSRESSRGSTIGKTSADRSQKSPTRKQSDAGLPDLVNPSFWAEHGLATDATPVPKKKKSTKRIVRSPSVERPKSVATSDPWDTWDDSPDLSRYGSSVASDSNTLPSTVAASPRTSTSNDLLEPQKKDPLPWPVMRKSSGLTTLRRTASNLMKDWETSSGKTSPTEELAGRSDYLGASAEAQAYGANSTTGKMYKD
ncbi:unnamed protein product [Zymoseptoria tritici ST99CH_3D7]|uniref:DUF4048 domain-containing protein n=2 Tax=Zymoseptoria tritici TaxID=1047171 RepID=A0A1X7S1H4_ZYMT9|nr:unnamed protein product [Zymoseptoria tritici ST99CH_3D7]